MADDFLLPAIEKRARLSSCGLYRYSLERWWNTSHYARYFIMLNPSTADASVDDPTIRRCIGLAKRDGYGGIVVINLFAFRATSPADMKRADDPIGPENDGHIWSTLGGLVPENVRPGTIIAAWGAHGAFRKRAAEVEQAAKRAGVDLFCFGFTNQGTPRHPLYLPGDVSFTRYPPQEHTEESGQ